MFKQAKFIKGLGRDIIAIAATLNLVWNAFRIDWETGSQVKEGFSSMSPSAEVHDVIISLWLKVSDTRIYHGSFFFFPHINGCDCLLFIELDGINVYANCDQNI